jgi:ferredoxin
MWAVGGKHAFVFNTHGTIPEYYFPSIVPKLKNRGLVVIGMRDWYADCFIPWHPEPYPTAGHPDEIDLKEAEEFGREMVERSRRISAGETGLIPKDSPVPPPLPSTESLNIQDTTDDPSVFKYHKELCSYPKCRLCMDNCPKYSIDLSMNPPVIAACCQPHCTFCTLICPTGAIEIDAFVESQVPNYRKTTETLALPRLDEAEAKGEFRRLIPVDKIGWKTYVYQVYTKHPKWIVGKGRKKPK